MKKLLLFFWLFFLPIFLFSQVKTNQLFNNVCWKFINGGTGIHKNGTLWELAGDNASISENSPNWKATCNQFGNAVFGIKTDGTLWGRGTNVDGCLGIGSFEYSSYPNYIQIGDDSNWLDIKTFENVTIGLKSDRTLWGWGLNSEGQLGLGDNLNRNVPAKIGNDSDWKAIAVGFNYAMAIKNDGTLWACGENPGGKFATKDTSNYLFNFSQIGSSNQWKEISFLNDVIMGLQKDGSVWMWGNYDDSIDNQERRIPTKLQGVNNVEKVNISTYGFGMCFLNDGSTVKVSYYNKSINNFVYENYPCPVNTNTNTSNTGCWREIAAGFRHSFAIKNDGTLWGWGANFLNQLGDGINKSKDKPFQIGSEKDWKIVRGGNSNGMAIKNDGTLWGWGDNYSGQLGNSTDQMIPLPTKIGVENNWKIVKSNFTHSLGIFINRIK